MLLFRTFTIFYGKTDRLKIISIAFISLILASCGAGRNAVTGNKTSATLQEDIIRYGRQYLGKPYRYAGKGPNSFDCSGYTSFVFRKFGYQLDPSSAGQARQTASISVRKELRKGDLVFFEGNRKNGRVGHVGIVTQTSSNGHFKFIHSSTSSGVIISSSKEPYYASRYLRGGRVLEENASYVTRGNPSTNKKTIPSYALKPKTEASHLPIPKVDPNEKKSASPFTTGNENHSQYESESVILVQSDPAKNRSLEHRQPISKGKEQSGDSLLKIKNNTALREERTSIPTPPKSYTVKMGDTLYSIAKQFGCSIEQIKEWNPHIGSLLKSGEKLQLFIQ